MSGMARGRNKIIHGYSCFVQVKPCPLHLCGISWTTSDKQIHNGSLEKLHSKEFRKMKQPSWALQQFQSADFFFEEPTCASCMDRRMLNDGFYVWLHLFASCVKPDEIKHEVLVFSIIYCAHGIISDSTPHLTSMVFHLASLCKGRSIMPPTLKKNKKQCWSEKGLNRSHLPVGFLSL